KDFLSLTHKTDRHTHTHTHTHTLMLTHRCTFKQTHRHTNMHARTHTLTHLHTHTLTDILIPSPSLQKKHTHDTVMLTFYVERTHMLSFSFLPLYHTVLQTHTLTHPYPLSL